MKTRSLQANYIFSIIRIVISSIVGLLIIAQANRALGPIHIGKVEYATTIISYFMMFSSLGIPIYGIREIAKVRDDPKALANLVVELITILLITSLICYLAIGGAIFAFDLFQDYKSLLIIFSTMIFLTNIGAEWFFQGVEDQLYITIRYVVVRVICLILLYLFVRDEDDYLNYAYIMVLYLCGSNIFNFYFIFKKIDLSFIQWSGLAIKRHIKPIITIFAAAVSVNIYLQLDNFLIGYLAGDQYLGYYSISNKLIRYVITFITVGGTVLLPRLSNLFDKNVDEYYALLAKAFDFILLFSIPFSFFFFVFAHDIIMAMGGEQFHAAVLTLKILSPLCVIIGVAYFIGYLVLIPQKKELIYTSSVIWSALLSLSLNVFVIRYWKQDGAAVVQLLAEILSVGIMFFAARGVVKYIQINWVNIMKVILVSTVVASIGIFIKAKLSYDFQWFLIQASAYFIALFLLLLIVKESTLTFIKNFLLIRLKK